jgi:hypothetical protein
MELDEDIRKLMKEVIVKELTAYKNGQSVIQTEDKPKGNRKQLIGLLNDADKNIIESRKVENDKVRNDIEREKLQFEREKLSVETEIECAKRIIEEKRINSEAELEKLKLGLERIKIDSEQKAAEDRTKYDFYGKLAVAVSAVITTLASLGYVNKWTKWGFIQEEFGSITGKTMNNVMRNWTIKRS